MTEQEQNRLPSGRYTFDQHATSTVTVGGTKRRPELDGWPESLPEPEVTFEATTTTVSINGEPIFEVWNPEDDIYSTRNESFVHDLTQDEDVHEAAETWARNKHNEIADVVREAAKDAGNRVKAGAIAKATGKAPQLTDEELGNLVGLNQQIAYTARRDAEYAATAVIARGVLKDHPDASHIGLRIDYADNGEFVSGAVVYNAGCEVIGTYDADADHVPEYAEHLGSLDASPDKGWWSEYNMPGYDPDDAYTINLAQAAAWAPDAQA